MSPGQKRQRRKVGLRNSICWIRCTFFLSTCAACVCICVFRYSVFRWTLVSRGAGSRGSCVHTKYQSYIILKSPNIHWYGNYFQIETPQELMLKKLWPDSRSNGETAATAKRRSENRISRQLHWEVRVPLLTVLLLCLNAEGQKVIKLCYIRHIRSSVGSDAPFLIFQNRYSTCTFWCSLLLCCSWPSGWKHRHTVPDQQSRARQDSQTVDQTLRHIEQLQFSRAFHPTHTHTHLHKHTHTPSTLPLLWNLWKHTHPVPVIHPVPTPWDMNCYLFHADLKASFYTKSLLGLYFPIHWMLIWSWKALILLLFLLMLLFLLHCS